MTKKGFTLIELIIVIGIIALLATTVILVINPVRIFQEARDSQRLADLGQLSSAISLYLATSSATPLLPGACLGDWWASISAVPTASQPFANPPTAEAAQTHGANPWSVGGGGWIPLNFTTVSGGSPLSALPRDPRNNSTGTLSGTGGGLFYAFQCDAGGTSFELNANMESGRYGNTGGTPGGDDVESTDGGTSASIFEVGNAPGLGL